MPRAASFENVKKIVTLAVAFPLIQLIPPKVTERDILFAYII